MAGDPVLSGTVLCELASSLVAVNLDRLNAETVRERYFDSATLPIDVAEVTRDGQGAVFSDSEGVWITPDVQVPPQRIPGVLDFVLASFGAATWLSTDWGSGRYQLVDGTGSVIETHDVGQGRFILGDCGDGRFIIEEPHGEVVIVHGSSMESLANQGQVLVASLAGWCVATSDQLYFRNARGDHGRIALEQVGHSRTIGAHAPVGDVVELVHGTDILRLDLRLARVSRRPRLVSADTTLLWSTARAAALEVGWDDAASRYFVATPARHLYLPQDAVPLLCV